MSLLKRTIVGLTLVLTVGEVFAQGNAAPPARPGAKPSAENSNAVSTTTNTNETISEKEATSSAAGTSTSSMETRNQFSALLRQSPPELGTILALDPTLLSNDAFLTGYPDLARFVAAHTEVRRNPRFFLEEFQPSARRRGLLEEILEGVSVFCVFLLISFVMTWLVKTIIDQKRWNRLSKTQSEVHNKILDRFSTSDELIAYVRSPAGTKFLESAPIPLHAEQATQNVPLTRILWSIQFGVVVVAGALGVLMVSGRFDPESSKAIFALGVIALSVGVGFIASALVSLVMSRRLGLWPGAAAAAALVADDSGNR